jgi:cytochrome b561
VSFLCTLRSAWNKCLEDRRRRRRKKKRTEHRSVYMYRFHFFVVMPFFFLFLLGNFVFRFGELPFFFFVWPESRIILSKNEKKKWKKKVKRTEGGKKNGKTTNLIRLDISFESGE